MLQLNSSAKRHPELISKQDAADLHHHHHPTPIPYPHPRLLSTTPPILAPSIDFCLGLSIEDMRIHENRQETGGLEEKEVIHNWKRWYR